MKKIYLTGAPASGKTTLGRRLAKALDVKFVDLDEEIVRSDGRPIPEIFAVEGEAGFRAREKTALAALAARAEGALVVALGGGTLLDEANRKLCEKTGTVICLETPSEEELARRLGAAAGTRPLGNRARERAAHYASFPHRIAASFDLENSLVVVGEGIAPALLGDVPYVMDGNLSRISRKCAHGSAPQCAHGSAPQCAHGSAPQCAHGSAPQCARGSASQWAHFREMRTPLLTIPSGEEHKTISTVASIWSACAAAGLGRRDRIAAVGGGVTGDLTGFAAATWMRGIDWINVPTTLLAMVDASTGGKTGCDLPEGKNLAGAFHSPRLVIIDTDFLKTLPAEILAAGRAEMIKHDLLGEGEGVGVGVGEGVGVGVGVGERSRCRAGGLPSASEIAANLAVKVGIVREDPFERTGRRLLLNCGHTVAHAVEKLTDYRVSHGEAVAIGCVEEARLAVRLGLAAAAWPDELASVFAAAGLPTALPDRLTFDRMKSVMAGDKKREGDTVTFALPCGWGDVRGVPVRF